MSFVFFVWLREVVGDQILSGVQRSNTVVALRGRVAEAEENDGLVIGGAAVTWVVACTSMRAGVAGRADTSAGHSLMALPDTCVVGEAGSWLGQCACAS